MHGARNETAGHQNKLEGKKSMKRTLQLIIGGCVLAWSVTTSAQETNQPNSNYTSSPASSKGWEHTSMMRTNDFNQSEATGNTNIASEADNTAVNVRDRNNNTVTPLDQGNSQPDLNTTAQIRKEIIADKSLSVDAQNVKIITANGRVVLRGPVNNAGEKRHICDIAKNVAGTQNVDDQLEVTTSDRTH
jgi:hyperosmotically inducible protein